MLKTFTILGVAMAVTQVPAPTPQQTSNVSAGHGANTEQASPARTQNPLATTPSIPDTVIPSAKGDQTQCSQNNTQAIAVRELPTVSVSKSWEDWALWGTQIFLAMAGLGGMIYAFFTLKEVRRQADVMETTLEETKKASNATRDSVTAASDTAIRQLRAYLAAHQFGVMNIRENEVFGVGFAFVNYGQTPALKFNLRGAVDLLPFPLPQEFIIPEPLTRDTQDGIIFPKENNPMTGWVWEYSVNKITVPEKLALFSKETKRQFYAHGTATYVDVFGVDRTTVFCLAINPHSVIRNQVGDIVHNKEGDIQFQWMPIAGRNSVN